MGGLVPPIEQSYYAMGYPTRIRGSDCVIGGTSSNGIFGITGSKRASMHEIPL
jgi:hypothetical protein